MTKNQDQQKLNEALIEACRKRRFAEIPNLIKQGADVNFQDQYSWTPLMRICQSESLETVKLLVKAGANVNFHDKYGVSPLLAACAATRLEAAEFLVSKGAKVNTWDAFGNTPLSIACERGYQDFATFLRKHGGEIVEEHTPEQARKFKELREEFNLIEEKAAKAVDRSRELRDSMKGLRNSVYQGKELWSPYELNTFLFTFCSDDENLEIVKWMVEQKVGVDIESEDGAGETPVFGACEYGAVQILKFLLKKGVNIKHSNIKGETPLFYACAYGHLPIVKLLLDNGADINTEVENTDGNCRF